MGRINENNKVTASGEIVSDFIFSHEVYGENFYNVGLQAMRNSGVADILPIMVSDRLVDVKSDWKGKRIELKGQFRSYDKRKEDKNRVILSVFAKEFEEVEDLSFSHDEDYIFLDGFICKEPVYRKTPLGREIGNIIVAVNRPYGKSDYIPCICWGRNARFAGNLAVGTHIQIEGRIQSREYLKCISDTESEAGITYEVSVNKITVIEEIKEDEYEKKN